MYSKGVEYHIEIPCVKKCGLPYNDIGIPPFPVDITNFMPLKILPNKIEPFGDCRTPYCRFSKIIVIARLIARCKSDVGSHCKDERNQPISCVTGLPLSIFAILPPSHSFFGSQPNTLSAYGSILPVGVAKFTMA